MFLETRYRIVPRDRAGWPFPRSWFDDAPARTVLVEDVRFDGGNVSARARVPGADATALAEAPNLPGLTTWQLARDGAHVDAAWTEPLLGAAPSPFRIARAHLGPLVATRLIVRGDALEVTHRTPPGLPAGAAWDALARTLKDVVRGHEERIRVILDRFAAPRWDARVVAHVRAHAEPTARDLGFFDAPRRVSVYGVAAETGVSSLLLEEALTDAAHAPRN